MWQTCRVDAVFDHTFDLPTAWTIFLFLLLCWPCVNLLWFLPVRASDADRTKNDECAARAPDSRARSCMPKRKVRKRRLPRIPKAKLPRKRFLRCRFAGSRRLEGARLRCRSRALRLRVQRIVRKWSPYTATRVGEASNPGPAGASCTRRARYQKYKAFNSIVKAVCEAMGRYAPQASIAPHHEKTKRRRLNQHEEQDFDMLAMDFWPEQAPTDWEIPP